ncbi:protein translocase subunit secF,protein translocase subunit secD [Aequorivita sublithincola DSM 14238]|uniref:Multifunctional fusion protein n=1 Tax=Aequorivita sublithincola (strain DSM 14238 / LMG 21431 / ACAM 643 / 9-3) TaxID=746697 RepID=I3YSX2_AEQSU|nr:protein translocase subunit SecDF [Aequorivita sublithincola]AFL80090.1 protein translocase subunit secF,protein translocase subunit secD [Aequorivita sublithincola DSM 14238]
MQNKGLITVFAVLFGLVSIYQLSFTYIANNVEDSAKEFANNKFTADQPHERDSAEARYLDSVGAQPIFLGIDYNTAKEKELNKGLDLEGGINVILEVSVKDILKGLANNTKDAAFNQALENAADLQKESQDTYLESFFKAFEALPGENNLASPDIFFNKNLEDVINVGMTNAQVKPVIEKKIDESITSAFEVLRKRIDKFGVTQPNIQRLGKSARILVELPGAKDVARVRKLLQSTAQLEFWDVYKFEDMAGFLQAADAKAGEIAMAKTSTETETTKVADTSQTVVDSTKTEEDDVSKLLGGQDVKDSLADNGKANPILSKMVTLGSQGSPVIAVFRLKDTSVVNGYLRNPQIKSLLSNELRYAKFVWGLPEANLQLNGEETTALYALKGNRDNVPPLGGSVVVGADQEYDNLSRVVVSMQMNGQGAKVWEQMTGNAYQNQSQIAIVLDDIVYSAPGVTSGPISGGRSQISGNFTVPQGQDLANVLRAGKLPASAEIIQGEVVGPTLGQEAINSGVMSFVIALFIVLLWMIGYYGKAGAFADIALMVNILFIFGILAGLGAVLTLPGIAGIVLTVGMSVDANVLIFERIKEELAKGKAQKDAIKDGFNNALSSILDANITTGLTGLILLVFGTGPIQGFATTLLIGIATSLFTAIFITRLFIDSYTKNGKPLPCSTSVTKDLFKNVNIQFLKKRKAAYILSAIMILVSVTSLFTLGLNQGVDFVGGRTYTVRFAKDVNSQEIQNDLIKTFGSAEAKTYGGDNQLKITTKYKVDETGTDVDEEIEHMLFETVKKEMPADMTYDQFIGDQTGKTIGRMEYYKVSPTIADDIKKDSFWAVFGSLVVVFLYILLRFRRWQFGLGAVAAIFHDVVIVLGVFSLTYRFMPFSMEIDQAFIAAILTVVGYSLNDTVIVFDRIREYFNEHSAWKMNRVIDVALNSTLGRTLNTSFTTLIVLLCMFFFGAESIRGLLFAIIVGIFVGTYSSLFIATPLMYDTIKRKKIEDLIGKKEEDEAAAALEA